MVRQFSEIMFLAMPWILVNVESSLSNSHAYPLETGRPKLGRIEGSDIQLGLEYRPLET